LKKQILDAKTLNINAEKIKMECLSDSSDFLSF